MRRRAADFRRPVRRGFSCWIWTLIGLFSIAGFILFIVQHFDEDRVEQPTLVSNFIYNHGWVLALMRANTNKDIVRPAATRFATAYLTLQSMHSLRQPLEAMFTSREWANCSWAKKPEGREARKIILSDRNFWGSVGYAIKTTKPLVSVLRMTDSEKVPGMGFLYGAMDNAKEEIAKNLDNEEGAYKEIWSIIDAKWDNQLHRHLHAAAYFLNPHFHYDDNFCANVEVKVGLYACMDKLIPNSEEREKADLQLDAFRLRQGLFGYTNAKNTCKKRAPADWWIAYGDEAPELRNFAVKILSLTCSSSACERNWSTFSQERNARNVEVAHERLNFTEEIISANSYARQLAEQMTLAKAYIVIAKEHNNLHLAWELSSKIRSCQFLLSKAAMREEPITLAEAKPIIKSLSSLIFKAQDAHYDIATTIMTMKSHIQALEERANAATVQSSVFGQLAAEALPKNLHCVNVKLMADWLKKSSLQELADEKKNSPRLVDNNLYHLAIFSDNLLAVSVVVNSTVSNADHPKQLVFHIVTNGINYGAMQAWFLSNDFKGSAIEVLNIEGLTWLNASYSLIIKRLTEADVWAYYFKGYQDDNVEPKIRNPKYISLLNHLRFYIPEIYPQLEKVVFLDDDVVVQKDLTPLFSLDLHGNVNGAVETCLEAFHRYYKYLNFSNPIISSKIDPQACGWAFGVNVFDLIAWRKADVTARYHYWQEQNADKTLWKLGTLPAGLLAFYGLTEPLDRRWHVLGLGYDLNIDNRLIESAAVIHFNGNMKPWQKFGINRYRPLWERYVNQAHPYIQDCVTS